MSKNIMDVVFQEIAYTQHQEPIPNVTSLEDLRSTDYYSHQEDFDEFCQNHYNHQPLLNPEWRVANVHKSRLYPSTLIPKDYFVRFVRNSDVKLCNVLSYVSALTLKPFLMIRGCRRIGKSTCTFGWLLSQPRSFLWIHNKVPDGMINLVTRNEDGILQSAILRGGLQELTLFVDDLVWENQHPEIVCLDGHFGDEAAGIVDKLHNKNRLMILCTSNELMKLNMEFLDYHDVQFYSVDSWSLSEYQTMNQHTDLLQHLNDHNHDKKPLTDAQIHDRFYYSGGCFQWFVEPSTSVVQFTVDMILGAIFAVHQQKTLLLQERIGLSPDAAAVNRLLSLYQGRSRIVSQYVCDVLMWCTADMEVICAAKKLEATNPHFRDFLAELEVKARLRIRARHVTAFPLYNTDRNRIVQQLMVADCVHYGDTTTTPSNRNGFFLATSPLLQLEHNRIYLPSNHSYNNSAFDFVHFRVVHSVQHVTFVKVTVAESWDFNYTPCASFLTRFFAIPAHHPPTQAQALTATMFTRHRAIQTGYHVHVYLLTPMRYRSRVRLGSQENLADIQQFDPLFRTAKIRCYIEEW